MISTIYLDHAAATPLDPRVKQAMEPYLTVEYGNAQSPHLVGQNAAQAIHNARISISRILTCMPGEIVFCSSGTESINLAILGVARANAAKGKHIITSAIEHKAVLESCTQLEREGFSVTCSQLDKFGRITTENLNGAIRADTILVSFMQANNEIGTINDIVALAKIAHAKGALFHSDACQSAGYLDINVHRSGVDLLSLNGSKLYGPKGSALLYVRNNIKVQPLIFGGGQEDGLRSGTENVAAIAGLAEALNLTQQTKEKESPRLIALRDWFIAEVLKIEGTQLQGHPSNRLATNVNITFEGIEAESLLYILSEHGVCASSGSACTSKELDPSHVLLGIGVGADLAKSSIRFTLGRMTTKEVLERALEIIKQDLEQLRTHGHVLADFPTHGSRSL